MRVSRHQMRLWILCLAQSALAAGCLLVMSGCGAGSDSATSQAHDHDHGQAGPLAAFSGRDPSLRVGGDGTLHVAYVDEQPGGPAVFYRRLGSGSPLGPVRVSPAGLSVTAHGEVPPALEVLPGGDLVVAYPIALPGKWKNELRFQRSSDGGAHWSAPELLHAQRVGAHSYVSSAVTKAGEPVFAWLDDSTGHMGLHARWGSGAPVTLDPETCDCCGTAMLAGPKGEIWLAYRDDQDDIRDFRLLRADQSGNGFDAGRTLSADHWKIQGCPHTGARLAQAADGRLWAAWFTAGEEGEAGIYAVSSTDDGATFGQRALVAASSPGHMVRHPELGTTPDGGPVVLYEAEKGNGQVLMAQVRDARTGRWEPREVSSGGSYPRWARGGDTTALAFTCHSEEKSQVLIANGAAVLKDELAGLQCESAAPSHSGHST